MSRPLRITFQLHNGAEFTLQCHTYGQEAVVMAALEGPTPDVCMTCTEYAHGQCDDCGVNAWRIAAWQDVQARLTEGFRSIGGHFGTTPQTTSTVE